ncbi:MAG: hypothetical protein ACPGRX_04715 [Bdellovibrionales bacterium]
MRFIFVAAFLILPAFAVAQDDTAQAVELTAEGAGLLKSPKEGAFEHDFWKGTDRREVIAALGGLPVNSESPAVQGLIRKLLLSEASADVMGPLPPEDFNTGHDLLALRLNALLRGGFYDDALALFSSLEPDTLSEHHRQAGLYAMLGSGQKSLACVEVKAVEKAQMNLPFWADLRAYCDYTIDRNEEAKQALTETNHDILRAAAFNDDFRFNYTPDAYAALSDLERLVLIADQKIRLGDLSWAAAREIPARYIGDLMHLEDTPNLTRLNLQLRGYQLGLVSLEQLSRFYKESNFDHPLLTLFKSLTKDRDSVDKAAMYATLSEYAQIYGAVVYVPFLPFIDEGAPVTSPDDLHTLLHAYYRAGQPVPAFVIYAIAVSEPSAPLLYAAAYVAQTQKSYKNTQKIYESLKALPAQDFFANNVIENLDKGAADVDNTPNVYEKDFVLTSHKPYVMPTWFLWNRLKDTAQNKILAETVLLSVLTLQGQNMAGVYPVVLIDVVDALNTVGLTHVSEDLALESLIGDKN